MIEHNGPFVFEKAMKTRFELALGRREKSADRVGHQIELEAAAFGGGPRSGQARERLLALTDRLAREGL